MAIRKAFTCSGTSEGLSYFICCASFLLVLYIFNSTESFHFHRFFFMNVTMLQVLKREWLAR